MPASKSMKSKAVGPADPQLPDPPDDEPDSPDEKLERIMEEAEEFLAKVHKAEAQAPPKSGEKGFKPSTYRKWLLGMAAMREEATRQARALSPHRCRLVELRVENALDPKTLALLKRVEPLDGNVFEANTRLGKYAYELLRIIPEHLEDRLVELRSQLRGLDNLHATGPAKVAVDETIVRKRTERDEIEHACATMTWEQLTELKLTR